MGKATVNKNNKIAEIKELLVYYREITETVREPFLILDSSLCIVTANATFYRKFKVNKKKTEGKRIYDLGNGQWSSLGLRELLERILPAHKKLNNYTVTHDFPYIGRRTMLLNAKQVDAKQLILLAMEDVTAQIKFKDDSDKVTANLIKQRDTLQDLNAAKDEFILLASHQLRTPATAVKQSIGMLSQGYIGELTQEQVRMLEIAYVSNQRQLEIIEDLLRVARVDSGKVYLEKSASDVVRLVNTVIQKQTILFKNRGQRVLFIKPRKKVVATIDPKLLSMVIENLLDNASKYSPSGGQIDVQVLQTDVNTIITVQDKGVGIRKSDSDKLFKKFSRIDNPFSISVGGTGLSLYWAKKVLDLHGGSIEVTSRLNIGSTFTVKMPSTGQMIAK